MIEGGDGAKANLKFGVVIIADAELVDGAREALGDLAFFGDPGLILDC